MGVCHGIGLHLSGSLLLALFVSKSVILAKYKRVDANVKTKILSTPFPGFSPTRLYGALRVGERTWERGCLFFSSTFEGWPGWGGLIEGGGLKESGAYLI